MSATSTNPQRSRALSPRHPSASRPRDGAKRVGAVLVLYHRPTHRAFQDAATVTEHIGSFARHSRFPVIAVNTAQGPRPGLRHLRFEAILLHYSMFGSGVYRLDDGLREYLAQTDAYKVAFFQDEFYYCGKRFSFLDDHAVDCVFTCLTEPEFGKVYGRYTKVPTLVTTLPGYVSDDVVQAAARYAKPDRDRHIDVGYRGRPLMANMGSGAQEKTEIALRFAERAASTDLALDIAIEETDRLYGPAWYEFLGDCRCLLGVESGVSAFDLEDVIRPEFERRLEADPDLTVEDLADVLAPWEDQVYYRTIGPRHFEAAAFRICQVLYEGRYSDLLEPMRHYIPLRKDFSNFDEVVARIADPDVRRELTANAHRDLIASGELSYTRFVEDVDRALAGAGIRPRPLAPEEDALIRSHLAEGRLERLRADPPFRIADALHEVYIRTPAPVLRALRRALDHFHDDAGPAERAPATGAP